MVEDTKAEETVDTAEETKPKSTEEGETQTTEEKSTDKQTIAESVEAAKDKFEEKEAASEPPAEEPAAEESDETEEEEEDLSSFIEPAEKDGKQKRIDKLTAKVYQLEDALAKQETKPAGERVFTDAELNKAERTAMQDNDYDLLATVRAEREKNLERRLTKKYTDEQSRIQSDTQRKHLEWGNVQNNYRYLSSSDTPEYWKGMRNELNVLDPNSTLVKLTNALYSASNEQLVQIFGYQRDYRGVGGVELAASDALHLIQRKRKGIQPENKETKKLRKRLVREKRKGSLGSPGAQAAEADTTPPRPKTQNETLNEYINERKATKSKALGAIE